MELLSNRLASFSLTRTKKHNIPAHPAWPLPSSQYPRLLPHLLAEAGWFYSPSKEDPDLVTCFLCGKQVGGWGKEDDPFQEHVDHQQGKCGWARTKCLVESQKRKGGQGSGEVLKARFKDASELPQSKALEAARLSTFAKWWPHDKKKAWLPSSKNLAKAGFIFSPNEKGSDMASCLYCELGLDGWSPTDDPFHEHQVRTPKCPFFIATVYVPPKAGASFKVVQEEAAEDNDEEFEMIDAPTSKVMKTPTVKGKKAAEKAPSTAATNKSTTSAKSRSTRAAKESEPDPEPIASSSSVPAPSRHTRNGSTTSQISQVGYSTRGQPAVEPAEEEEEVLAIEEAPLGRSTRGKPAAAALAPKRSGRGKRAALEEEEEVEELDFVEEEEAPIGEEVEEEKPAAKGKVKVKAKKAAPVKMTKGKGKKAAAPVVGEEEEEEIEEKEVLEDEDKVMSEPPPLPPPTKLPSSTTHSRTASAPSTKAKDLPPLPPSSSTKLANTSTSSRLSSAPPSSATTIKSKQLPIPSSSKPNPPQPSSRIPTPIKSPAPRTPRSIAGPTPSSALFGTPVTSTDYETAKAQAVIEGAKSAEKVVQQWAKMFSPAPPSAGPSKLANGHGPVSPIANGATGAADEDEEEEEEVAPEPVVAEGGKEVSLTAEQGAILVEEWVRMEYQLRHDELKRIGEEETIGNFVREAAEARRRLVEDIEVEDDDE